MFSCQKNRHSSKCFLFFYLHPHCFCVYLWFHANCLLLTLHQQHYPLSRDWDTPSLLKLIEKPLSVMTNSNHRATNSCIVDRFHCAIHTWKQIKTILYVNVRKTVTSYEWNSLYKVMTFWVAVKWFPVQYIKQQKN